ncbi:hypothetical protein ABH932_003891 [Streptacidiphilus sp. MAP5-52]
MTMSPSPVQVKNRVRLIRSTRRYRPQQSAVANSRPIAAPISGPVDSPAVCAVVQMKSAVSSPSRPTARKLVTTSIPDPIASAALTFSLSSLERLRAFLRIQKTIAVTKATAMTLRQPPNASCAVADRLAEVKVSTAPKLRESPTAAATPVQTCGSRPFSPPLTRVATRMETTRPASNPSRNPIRKLGNASSHMRRTPPVRQHGPIALQRLG